MSIHQQRVSRKSVTRGCFSGLDQEWRIEWWRKRVPSSIKHLGTQLFWNWKSQPRLCLVHLRSNSPETAVSAFSRALPPEGPWGCNENLANAIPWATKGASTCWNIRALPSNHSSVPSSSNKCWSSPFPRHSCFPPIILRSLEVFCGFVLVWAVSWMSTHHSCLLDFSTMCSSLCHSAHTSSLHFPLGKQVWPH